MADSSSSSDWSSDSKPRVFISYAHGNKAFDDSVEDLARALRASGYDVITDALYSDRPPTQGWTAWMRTKIQEARFILIVCTEPMKRAFESSGNQPVRGATVEAALILSNRLRPKLRDNDFCYPIIPDAGSRAHVPDLLQEFDNNHRFPSGVERIDRLLGGPRLPASPVPPPDPPWSAQEALVFEELDRTDVASFRSALARKLGVSGNEPERSTPQAILLHLRPRPSPAADHVFKLFKDIYAALAEVLPGCKDNGARQAIERAATALYFRIAMHLVELGARPSSGSGASPRGAVARIPSAEGLVAAVVMAALCNGRVNVEIKTGSSEIKTPGVWEVLVDASSDGWHDNLLRKVLFKLYPLDAEAKVIHKQSGPLPQDQRVAVIERIAARIDSIRDVEGLSIVLVVPGAPLGAPLDQIASQTTAPIAVPTDGDDPASPILGVAPAKFLGWFGDFLYRLSNPTL